MSVYVFTVEGNGMKSEYVFVRLKFKTSNEKIVFNPLVVTFS